MSLPTHTQKVEYWGGPLDGMVAYLSRIPEPLRLPNDDEHVYRCCYDRNAEFFDCVRVARAWLMRAGEWARTTCRNGHELPERGDCPTCQKLRDDRHNARVRERNKTRPPRKVRESQQRARRAA